jgi:LuxR family maltose regulon positive regulatory protein
VAKHLTGEREPARQLLEEGARRGTAAAPHVQALCLAQLGLLAVERQDWAAADSLAARARAQVERAGLSNYATSALVYAVASHTEAHSGRVDASQADLQRARDLLARTDLSPWYEAECRIALARAALRLGDAAQARELLTEAASELERSPDATVPRRWIADCEAQAEQSSAKARRGWSLTTAELRVLQFLPTHLSFPEMAERLYVSANTVKTHARSVYRKLDASSRAEAVVRAREAGLLDQASHAGVGTAALAGLS